MILVWLFVIIFVLFAGGGLLFAIYDDKKIDKIFIERYGCTQEELRQRILNSPQIDQIVEFIVQQGYPDTITISHEGLYYMNDNDNRSWRECKFEFFGLDKLPNPVVIPRAGEFSSKCMNYAEILATELHKKMSDYYDLQRCARLRKKQSLIKPVEKEQGSFKGW